MFFWSETGLVVRPTVSDHITDYGSLRWLPAAAADEYQLQYRGDAMRDWP